MKTRINKHKLYVYTLHDRCRVLVTLELMIWWLGKATSMFFFNSWAFDHWTIGGLPLNFFFGFTPNKWGFLKRGYPKSGKIMKPFYTMYFFTIEPMVLGRVDLFFFKKPPKQLALIQGLTSLGWSSRSPPSAQRPTLLEHRVQVGTCVAVQRVEHVEWERIGCRHPKFWRKMRLLNAQKNQQEDWHLSNTKMRTCLCNVAIPRCTSLQYVRKWTEIETI